MATAEEPFRRLPPQSLEAEESVLGGVLLDNTALDRVVELLRPDDFYRGAHRRIFRAILDLAERNGKVFNIGINAATAAAKGIQDGDRIELESPEGKRVSGVARLTEGVHPECLSVPGILGRWRAGDRRSIGKGVHFNSLLTYSIDHMDLLSAALDACVKVRIRRVD